MWTPVLLLLLMAAACGVAFEATLSCDCFLRRGDSQHVSLQCLSEIDDHGDSGNSSLPDVQKRTTCEQVATRRELPGYKLVKGVGVYRVYRTQRGFINAANRCLRDGGLLAVPDTLEEASIIADMVSHSGAELAWVGIRRRAPYLPQFITLFGQDLKSLAFHKWADEHTTRRDDCCTLSGPHAGLSVRPCSQPLPFVCELPGGDALPAGYLMMASGRLLRRHEQSLGRDEAAQVCRAEGGHLALPRDDTQAEELLSLLEGQLPRTAVYVGLRADAHSGFHTDAGEPLELLNFVNWMPGEPRHAHPLESSLCVSLQITGTLKVTKCETQLPFICELKM